jgi:predicted Zn-dependent peptidase
VGTWVGVGSRDEPAELSGVSHFLEHLLFKGTRTRSAREINEAVDRVGGEMNAFTTKEYTAYYARLPAGRLPMAVGLLGEVLTEPALRNDDVASEREVILEELAMDEDSPEDLAHTVLFEDLFAGHPLGRETAGQRETVAVTTADDVRAFFETWYTPANFVVAAAGAIEHDELVRLVSDAFGVARSGASPLREPPALTKPALTVRRRTTEQVHLALGWRGVARDDADREALEVVNHVLGGGMSSRLFEEIRERRGLAYSVYSALASYGDAGAMSVYVGTTPDKLDEVIALTREQIDEVAAKGVSGDELDVAIGYLTGSYVLGLEDPSSRMARLGSQVTCYGAVRPVDEQLDRYRAVSLDDVGRAIGRVLATRPTAAAVGPITRKSLAARLS